MPVTANLHINNSKGNLLLVNSTGREGRCAISPGITMILRWSPLVTLVAVIPLK